VTRRKYIDPISPLEWIRQPIKSSKNASVIWKALVAAIQIIEKGLAWKVGDGSSVRLGRDPWVGCPDSYALSWDLIEHLNNRGFFFLCQIVDIVNSSIWRQEWLSGDFLALEGRWQEEWRAFRTGLLNSHIRITNEPDELRWVHSQTGFYSPKKGYDWLMSQKGWEEPNWWAKPLWKLKGPAKTRLLFWCVLQGKVPTWDFLQKRGKNGPGWCSLCKESEETPQQIFLTYLFSKSLWNEML